MPKRSDELDYKLIGDDLQKGFFGNLLKAAGWVVTGEGSILGGMLMGDRD